MGFESTHVACRYEQYAARSWASHSSDDEMAPRAEQRSAADYGQPAVCPSPPHLQHASASDAALSVSCANSRRRRTLHLLLCANHKIRVSIKRIIVLYQVLGLFIYTRPTGYGPSHAVSLGSEHSEENRWVPELYARLTYRRGHVESLTARQEFSSDVRFLE